MDDRRQATPRGTGTLGLAVLLVSLGMLFAAAIVAYVVIRLRSEEWPAQGSPGLPSGLWLSTALLFGSSLSIQRGRTAIRRGNEPGLRRYLSLTTGLTILFCGSQLWVWTDFFQQSTTFFTHLYGFTFYMLTGLHGLHIVGGLVALIFVAWRARRGAYSRACHAAVRHCAIYWHFLGATWAVLLGTLLLGG